MEHNPIHHCGSLKRCDAITKTEVQATTKTTSLNPIKPSPEHPFGSKFQSKTASTASTLEFQNQINIAALMSPLLLFVIFSLLSINRAQYRSQSPHGHGPTHQNPMAFSPSAFEFFHPDNLQPSTESTCAASGCRPLRISATVQSSLAYESRSTANKGGSQMTAGGIFVTIFGFVFVALLAMGVYYVMIKRRTNMSKSNYGQDEA